MVPDENTFGVPDLRSRFIVGAGQGPGLSNYPIGLGADVGKEKHTLLIDEMPSHSHSYFTNAGEYGSGNDRTNHSMANRTPSQTGPEGKGLPHNNLPPYYALTYIIKY
jgi:microcystin-dependent protein